VGWSLEAAKRVPNCYAERVLGPSVVITRLAIRDPIRANSVPKVREIYKQTAIFAKKDLKRFYPKLARVDNGHDTVAPDRIHVFGLEASQWREETTP
jgi:hypothetical protein